MRSQRFIKPLLFMGRGFLERSHLVRGGDGRSRVLLFSGLDLATLRRLNAQVAVDGDTPEAVARRYLESVAP